MRRTLKAISPCLLLSAAFLAASLAQAAVTQVSSLPALQAAVGAAQPGDTIIVRNGTYSSVGRITLSQSGTAGASITVKAETPGSVKLQGIQFYINGNYWVIEGFEINGAAPGQYEGVIHIDWSSNNIVRNSRFTGGRGYADIQIVGGSNNLIEQNTFDKNAGWHYISIMRPEAAYNRIRSNRFLNFNGGAILSTGGDGAPAAPHTVFERNYVGDGVAYQYAEMLRIKSPYAEIRDNTFVNNENGLVYLRMFHSAVVEGNTFNNSQRGYGGVMLNGNGHVIRNNYFENSGYMEVGAGDYLSPEDWADCGPNGTFRKYGAATNATIANNTMVRPELSDAWIFGVGMDYNASGRTGCEDTYYKKSYPPSSAKITNNLFVTPNNRQSPIAIGNAPGASWSNNIVSAPNPGNLPTGVNVQNVTMQRSSDGLLRPVGLSNVGFQGSKAPRNPTDVGASWTGGPPSLVTAPPQQLRILGWQ